MLYALQCIGFCTHMYQHMEWAGKFLMLGESTKVLCKTVADVIPKTT